MIGATIVLTFLFERSSGPILLRLVPDMGAETRAALERMLADTRWFGAGAGTFSAVGGIYQSDADATLLAPSAATAIFADMGWIGLSAAVVVSVIALMRLFFGALQRGRDFVLPCGGRGLPSLRAHPELCGSRIAAPGGNPVSFSDRGTGMVAERQPVLTIEHRSSGVASDAK